MLKHILSVSFLIIFLLKSNAQFEHNIWYFGRGLGLDFNLDTDTTLEVLTNGNFDNTFIIEGASAICDENGNLLFYTNGVNVWDSTHSLMPLGDTLYGGWHSAMSAIITPVIGNPNKHYIFTIDGRSCSSDNIGPKDEFDGLSYSIVDMTLPGNGSIGSPLGDIEPLNKNVNLVDSTAEKLTAIMHANNIDYWIITRKHNSNNFYAFLVTENGVCPTPVISSAGFYGSGGRLLVPSYDGNALISGESASTSPPGYVGRVQLYDFDRSCGIVSNAKTITTFNSTTSYYSGIAFSPNDSLIYAFRRTGFSAPFTSTLYQYKRFVPNPSSTQLTLNLGTWGQYPDFLSSKATRLGPDGKVYIANTDSFLSTLTDPNNYGNPGFVAHTINLNRVKGTYELNNRFVYQPIAIPESQKFAKSDTIICPGDSASLGNDVGCLVTVSWTPTSGLNDPNSNNPKASPASTTTYIAEIQYLCTTWYDSITVEVNDSHPIDLFKDTLICQNDSTIIGLQNAPSNYTFSWSSGSTLNSPSSPTPTTYLTDTTTYFITIDDQCQVWQDTMTIYTIPLYTTDELHNIGDASICLGDSVEHGWLNAPTHFSYLWTPDSKVSNNLSPYTYLSPETTTTYKLFTQNQCQVDSTSLTVLVGSCGTYIPNTFSPNGDSQNDIFQPKVSGADFTITIYDRYGNVIYFSENNEGWDGTFNGELANNGIYLYHIKTKDLSSKIEFFTGNIFLAK